MTEMQRVRTLLRYMDYGQLGKENIIPKERLFTKVPRFGKLPKLASRVGYWQLMVQNGKELKIELVIINGTKWKSKNVPDAK